MLYFVGISTPCCNNLLVIFHLFHFLCPNGEGEEGLAFCLTTHHVHVALQVMDVSCDILGDNMRPLLVISIIGQKWHQDL